MSGKWRPVAEDEHVIDMDAVDPADSFNVRMFDRDYYMRVGPSLDPKQVRRLDLDYLVRTKTGVFQASKATGKWRRYDGPSCDLSDAEIQWCRPILKRFFDEDPCASD